MEGYVDAETRRFLKNLPEIRIDIKELIKIVKERGEQFPSRVHIESCEYLIPRQAVEYLERRRIYA